MTFVGLTEPDQTRLRVSALAAAQIRSGGDSWRYRAEIDNLIGRFATLTPAPDKLLQALRWTREMAQ